MLVDLLLQAINGRADALGQLANILNTSVSQVQNGVNAIQSAVQTVGAQVGLSG
jgi:methyl-accepting chemotaxis protein